ncbi:S4 domain protein YaaA [Streptococcus constellatus subsp. pharyngis SK1060 = CCUG 46377]|uniref:S4 domain protein YaaA n=1 Tax=Streptococcus constellatus subsp. pharyngis SK1060 = CCUG 46377 TaxID=1035184 RepID=F9P9G8_STRCV|nr:S4 domain protein YaaA [Streptococcus constellatus subsp. pharyngis SK1060 = CCUG 46377]
MKYKLFYEYITLQALLKEVGIIQSGGAIKSFLQENQVYFNGDLETRRKKKIRIGDIITLPNQKLEILLTAPNEEERVEHEKELLEKRRVGALVKEMNKSIKKVNQQQQIKKPINLIKKLLSASQVFKYVVKKLTNSTFSQLRAN